ncbi:hypothetical protein V6N13_092336 [Hibiscus sabdariffa]
MRRSNEFKSCFTIRRAEGSDKLQIPSNRQRDEKVNFYSDLATSSGMRRSTQFRSCFIVRDEKIKTNSDLASSSEMRRSCIIVRDEKVNFYSDLATSSGMRRSTQFRSCFIVRDEKIKTNSDLASSSEMRRSNKFGSCLSGMRRSNLLDLTSSLGEQKVKFYFKSSLSVSGMVDQTLLQIQSIRQWNGGSNFYFRSCLFVRVELDQHNFRSCLFVKLRLIKFLQILPHH